MYSVQQARASIGIPNTTYLDDINTTLQYALYHCERPLIVTRGMKYVHTYELPAGQNVLLAMLCYGGDNIHFALIRFQWRC